MLNRFLIIFLVISIFTSSYPNVVSASSVASNEICNKTFTLFGRAFDHAVYDANLPVYAVMEGQDAKRQLLAKLASKSDPATFEEILAFIDSQRFDGSVTFGDQLEHLSALRFKRSLINRIFKLGRGKPHINLGLWGQRIVHSGRLPQTDAELSAFILEMETLFTALKLRQQRVSFLHEGVSSYARSSVEILREYDSNYRLLRQDLENLGFALEKLKRRDWLFTPRFVGPTVERGIGVLFVFAPFRGPLGGPSRNPLSRFRVTQQPWDSTMESSFFIRFKSNWFKKNMLHLLITLAIVAVPTGSWYLTTLDISLEPWKDMLDSIISMEEESIEELEMKLEESKPILTELTDKDERDQLINNIEKSTTHLKEELRSRYSAEFSRIHKELIGNKNLTPDDEKRAHERLKEIEEKLESLLNE